jgi:hypothetical protein
MVGEMRGLAEPTALATDPGDRALVGAHTMICGKIEFMGRAWPQLPIIGAGARHNVRHVVGSPGEEQRHAGELRLRDNGRLRIRVRDFAERGSHA